MQAYDIVGAHFRPPAKAILQCLPADVALKLVPEPDNEFDPNAIKVVVQSTDIPLDEHDNLETLAQGYGFSLEDILDKSEWHLGYIPRTDAVELAPILNGDAREGNLSFNPKGKPIVVIEL